MNFWISITYIFLYIDHVLVNVSFIIALWNKTVIPNGLIFIAFFIFCVAGILFIMRTGKHSGDKIISSIFPFVVSIIVFYFNNESFSTLFMIITCGLYAIITEIKAFLYTHKDHKTIKKMKRQRIKQ